MASAVLEENRDAVFCARLLDPLSAVVCFRSKILEELVLAEADRCLRSGNLESAMQLGSQWRDTFLQNECVGRAQSTWSRDQVSLIDCR